MPAPLDPSFHLQARHLQGGRSWWGRYRGGPRGTWSSAGPALGSCLPQGRDRAAAGGEHPQILRLRRFGVDGLRCLQPGTHRRGTPALGQARGASEMLVSRRLRAPCSQALGAEWKSLVSRDRCFSRILSIREARQVGNMLLFG